MIKLTGLNHIVLRTNKLDAMLQFYIQVLGCTIEKKQPEFHLTQLRAGHSLIDLINVDTPVEITAGNLAHFCLDIENSSYDALIPHFEKYNIKPERLGERYSARGYGDSFYLTDPQGNEVELALKM